MSHVKAGERVVKKAGYKFEGIVLAAFVTLNGVKRIAVENGDGIVHIFRPNQMERKEGGE